MINVHLNGDLVRCADIAEIRKRADELRNKKRICKFNYYEDNCDVWQSQFKIGRCDLCNSDNCPGKQKQKEFGQKDKKFCIDNKIYRKLASSSNLLIKKREKKEKTIFCVLSFPEFKVKPRIECKNKLCNGIFEKQINQSLHRFLDNLHNTYGVKYYVAVREYGKENDRIHFHLLFNMQFIDFDIINSAWCSAISGFCYYSKNAFRTKKEKRYVRTPAAAVRYCCKYFSKQRGARSDTRIVFISNNLLSHLEPVVVNQATGEIEVYKRISNLKKSVYGSVETILNGYKSIYINQSSDYTTTFRITDSKEFNRFCYSYLYELFKLSDNSISFNGFYNSKN